MQPYQPPLSHFYTDSPALKSRVYVQLFAWFGLLIAFLSLIQGRSLGLIHVPLFVLGVYASWDEVITRRVQLVAFASGCVVWTIFDIAYLVALVVATNAAMRDTAVGIVSSNTFANLKPALAAVLDALAKDAHPFVIFSALTACFFDAMAAYWACVLHRDIVEIVATTSHTGLLGAVPPSTAAAAAAAAAAAQQQQQQQQPHGAAQPLNRPHNTSRSAATIGGFGTFSRATQATQTPPRALHPFTGRGFRLGAGDTPQ